MELGTANTDFARRGDPKYIDFLAERAKVLCFQEAKDVIIREHLPEGWSAIQFGALAHHRAKMGSAIAYDSHAYVCVMAYQVLGCKPFWLGRRLGLLPRWITVAVLDDRQTNHRRAVISAHDAPWRFKFLQPGFKKNLKAEVVKHRYWVVGTDANEPIGVLAKYLGGTAYGLGIVGFVSSTPMEKIRIRHWGQGKGFTDHPAVTATAVRPS